MFSKDVNVNIPIANSLPQIFVQDQAHDKKTVGV